MTNKKIKESPVPIVQKDNKVLRQVSAEIPKDKIKSAEIKKIISDMEAAMDSQVDAVAIAAIQIGRPVRLFIISKRAFNLTGKAKDKDDMVFINPKIIKQSKKKQLLEEGCLSVRYVYGEVPRAEKTTIEAFDESGKKFTRGFSGLLSQIVQHETDHLNGGLFTDKAKHTIEISRDEYEKSISETK